MTAASAKDDKGAVAAKDRATAIAKQSSSGDMAGASGKKGKAPKQSRKWSAAEIDAVLKAVAALGSSDEINW